MKILSKSNAAFSFCKKPNGKIMVGGSDTGNNAFFRGYVLRLNADGAIDATFRTGKRAIAEVRALKIRVNNKLLSGGLFNRYHIFPRRSLAQVDL